MLFSKITAMITKRSIALILFSTFSVHADQVHQTDISFDEHMQPPLAEIRSVRNILGNFDPMNHTSGQLRLGYITFRDELQANKNGYALGGHYHFTTKSWQGIQASLAVYTVLNLGINQNQEHLNGDFFNGDGNSFLLISKAYLDAHWGKSKIKIGRQILNTPHLDSDDTRMMPNFFEAYTLTNNDIKDITLTSGFVTKMAGQGNGMDASKFIKTEKALGLENQNSNGIFYASTSYTGIEDFSLMFWYYNYHNIANIIYAEAAYNFNDIKDISLTLAMQYNQSANSGAALLGNQHARTYGLSAEAKFHQVGLTVLSAYTQDNGTGAVGLSLGGGPLFTSMEDQTLDMLRASGKAWMIGVGYAMEHVGVNGLTLGLAYAKFQAEDTSVYSSNEIDAVIEYDWNEKLTFLAVYASIDFDAGRDGNNNPLNDYQQFRLIGKYNF